MTRDEIYAHLAQVYLGKSQKNKNSRRDKRQFHSWLVINLLITGIIFAGSFYGLTAFFTKKGSALKGRIIYSLHEGTVQMSYDFKGNNVSPVKAFDLSVPQMDASKYNALKFSIRAREEGSPGVVKIVFKNKLNEEDSYYVRGVDMSWKDFEISLDELKKITDWASLTDVSFVLESWNVEKQKGVILIDDVRFATQS